MWRIELNFASFHCARCGEKGYVRDNRWSAAPDPIALALAKAEAAERERTAARERLCKAQWLWSTRKPIANTIAATYLRTARAYHGALPATIGFLPARGKHSPAMIAAFGIPNECTPCELSIPDDGVRGVHITRLAVDGSGKAGGETDKIMVGCSLGSPIVVAPANDLLGLAIAEGKNPIAINSESTVVAATPPKRISSQSM